MFKNAASQAVTLYAVDASTGLPKTGDSANMVFYVSKDDGTVTAISASSGVPTEADATNAKGDYKIALAQAETNADKLRFTGKSSTANVVVVPQTIYTVPANFTTQAIDASGRVDLGKILGTASQGTAGYVGLDWGHINAPTTAVTLSGTALPKVWDEVLTGATHNVANSAGKLVRLINPNSDVIYSSTLPSQSGVASNQVKLDTGASSVDGAYAGTVMTPTAGTGTGSRVCLSYVGSTRLATLDSAWPVSPVSGDTVQVTPSAKSQVIGYASSQDPFTLVMIGDMSTITGEASRSPLNALRFLRNKWSISGSTLTVTKEDDATSAWTSAITATAGASPITASDPT